MSNENTNLENSGEQPQNENQAQADQDEQSTAATPDETLEYVPFSDDIDDDPPTISKESGPTEDQVRIQLLEDQHERMKDQMIRALADAENTRKRAQKEREDASKFAVSSFARDLLSVADNLRRALDAVTDEMLGENPNMKNLMDGVSATEREMLSCFERNGIVKIEPLDEKFDPNFHEVMFEAPMLDKESGTIIQILEPGYMINDRILRPARVGISKNDGGGSTPPSSPDAGHAIDTEV